MSDSGKTVTEESFCSNFVCCGVHLADLHALLQHYEDVHVKVQDGSAVGDDDSGQREGTGDAEDAGEEDELDVVGDGPAASRLARRPDKMRRTDSVLSTHSFGSQAAAESLLGVATHYAPPPPPPQHPQMGAAPGYYYPPHPPPPPPQYYAPMPGREQPVSAFDTTILRTVSPAMAGAYGAPPPGYPGYYPPGAYYSPYYPPPPPHHMYMAAAPYGTPYPMPQPAMMVSPMPADRPVANPSTAAGRKSLRAAPPNLRAVQAASSSLRETLPAALGAEQADPSQFKLIYSILSNTLTPSNSEASSGTASAASTKEQEALDKATQAKNTAAAILAMPRPPVDKSLERPYICPVPGCGKAYKNPNGLKYHALHGHDGTQELVERPYRCPYGDCGKRYKNPNGLKYHVNKNHADMLPKSALVARSAQSKSGDGDDDEDSEHDHSIDEDEEAHDHSGNSEDDGGDSDDHDN